MGGQQINNDDVMDNAAIAAHKLQVKYLEPGNGKMIFVSTAGSDDNDGYSPQTAVKTFTQALAIAAMRGDNMGDVIMALNTGTAYDLDDESGDTIVVNVDGIKIIGQGGNVKLTGKTTLNCIEITASDILIQGFNITAIGAAGAIIDIDEKTAAYDNIVIRNCKGTTAADGIKLLGASGLVLSNVLVEDCEFTASGITTAGAAIKIGVYVTDVTFSRCILRNSNAAAGYILLISDTVTASARLNFFDCVTVSTHLDSTPIVNGSTGIIGVVQNCFLYGTTLAQSGTSLLWWCLTYHTAAAADDGVLADPTP